MGEGLWATATASNGEQSLIFRYLMELPDSIDSTAFPWLMTVVWPYQAANAGGMPDGPTNERQIEFEDLVDPAVEGAGNAHLVWVMTGDNVKVWRWYSRDAEAFFRIVTRALADREPFPIEIESENDPEWTIWREYVESVVVPDE